MHKKIDEFLSLRGKKNNPNIAMHKPHSCSLVADSRASGRFVAANMKRARETFVFRQSLRARHGASKFFNYPRATTQMSLVTLALFRTTPCVTRNFMKKKKLTLKLGSSVIREVCLAGASNAQEIGDLVCVCDGEKESDFCRDFE